MSHTMVECDSWFIILNQGAPYPSEKASIEQQKVRNKLEDISIKLNEFESKREPVIAFRVTGVRDSGDDRDQSVTRDGEF